MPPEGGRGAAGTPLGVKWVNVPSGDERAKPSGRPVFFERPPPQGKGGATIQPERARKRSDRQPDYRYFLTRGKRVGWLARGFGVRRGKAGRETSEGWGQIYF